MSRENRLFLGNPGAGKSTLINCLVGSFVFQSGANWGHSRTKDFQRFESDGVLYMDTPGLANSTINEHPAEAITPALKHPGSYKLFFVVKFQNGRVVTEDLATIESVLDAIEFPNVAYSVIVNNVNKNLYQTLSERGRGFNAVVKLINSGKYSTTDICLVPTIEELVGNLNRVATLPREVTNFVEVMAPVNWVQESVRVSTTSATG